MKKLLSLSLLAMVTTVGQTTAQAVPVLWSSAVGGNDHYYEIIRSPAITWDEANAAANAATYNGLQGHLATVTSQGEQDFISDVNFVGDSYGLYGDLIWLGGYQDIPGSSNNDLDGADANWHWVTGEAWDYTNWSSTEPNNGRWLPGQYEDYLSMTRAWFNPGYWSDSINSALHTGNMSEAYIIEYEPGHAPVPEPATILLFGAGLAGLVGSRARKKKK